LAKKYNKINKEDALKLLNKEEILNRIGKTFVSNEGCKFKIIEIINSRHYIIEFENGFVMKVSYGSIRSGKIKNPYHPSVCGVGYLGIGVHKFHIGRKSTHCCQIWKGMMNRGYSQVIKEKQPAYKNVIVCEVWHNFQNFAEWYNENWKLHMQGWAIDKDIVVRGNQIYSSERCEFVPQEINNLFLKSNKTRGEYPVGVHEQKGRYYAILSKNNKKVRVGGYATPEEAFRA
jgi:hypothetical protein